MVDTPDPNQHDSGCIAVVLVHGVGAVKNSQTLTDFCDALERELGPETFEPELLAVRPDEDVLFERQGNLDGVPIRVASCYWGDISLVQTGFISMVQSIAAMIVGLRYISYHASDYPTLLAQAQKYTLATLLFLVECPLLSLYMLALLHSLSVLFFSPEAWAHGTAADYRYVLVSLVGISLGVIGLKFSRRHTRIPNRAMICFIIVSLGSLGLVALLHYLGEARIVRGFEKIRYYAGIGGRSRAGLYLAVIWYLQDWIMLLAMPLVTASLLLWSVSCITSPSVGEKRSLTIACASAYLFWILIALLVEPIELITFAAISKYSHENVDYPFYWYEMLLFAWVLLMMLFAVAIYFLRDAWSSSHRDCLAGFKDREHVDSVPVPERLIFHWFVLCLIFAFAVISSSVGLLTLLRLYGQGKKDLDPRFAPVFVISLAVLATSFILILTSTIVRQVLHIILDIANHFCSTRERTTRLDQGESKFVFPIRKLISNRLIIALDHLIMNGRVRHLLVVAHSQGTVVVMDQIVDGSLGARLNGVIQDLTLITMGSPYTHIYQHYFANLYPELGVQLEEGLPCCSNCQFRWINLFRIDDYVGTFIGATSGLPGASQPLIRNVPLGPGGWSAHTGYWKQDSMQQIVAEISRLASRRNRRNHVC